MKRSFIKILSCVLAVVMALSTFPIFAFAKTTKPAVPKSVSATSTVNTVTVKWGKASKAKGYTLYKYDTKTKKSTTVASTTKTSYKVTKLKAGTTYCYYVKAYLLSGKKKVYSSASAKVTVSTLPTTPTVKVVAKAYNSIYVSWAKITGATSYKLQYSTDKTFKSGVKSFTQTALTKTISGLNEQTTYYFRLYAYRKVGTKTYTSAVSKVVYVKTPEKPTDSVTTVDFATTYQTINGFGASAAWWSKKVGTWSSEDATKAIELLYSKDKGIGLNIYRYNLGAGSAKTGWNDENPTNVNSVTGEGDDRMDVGKSAESFVDTYNAETGEFTYNWNNDEGAKNCLDIANVLCPNLRVTLFFNSPPVELTNNGRATGYYLQDSYVDENGITQPMGIASQNIIQSNYAPFAKYANACAKHFVDMGYRVTDVSPVNEPQFAWTTDEKVTNEAASDFGLAGWSSQEGCHYYANGDWVQGTQIRNSIELLYAEMIDSKNGYDSSYNYKMSAWEAAAAEAEYENNNKSAFVRYTESLLSYTKTKRYFDTLSVHSYWSDKARKQACRDYIDNNTKFDSLDIACTEYCQMTNDPTTGVFEQSSIIEWWDPARNGLGIDYGVQMARTMYEDLTVLNCVEWDWWTACSNGYYPDGLVYLPQDYKDHEGISTSKRLWCMGNYSKFIEEGAVRTKVTETNSRLLSSAYKNPDGSLAIVYVNTNDTALTTKLSVPNYSSYSVYTTDITHNLENTANASTSTGVINLPAQSVVTVVMK